MDILVIALTAWKSQEWMAEKQKEAIMLNGVRLPKIGAWIEGAGERERERDHKNLQYPRHDWHFPTMPQPRGNAMVKHGFENQILNQLFQSKWTYMVFLCFPCVCIIRCWRETL